MHKISFEIKVKCRNKINLVKSNLSKQFFNIPKKENWFLLSRVRFWISFTASEFQLPGYLPGNTCAQTMEPGSTMATLLMRIDTCHLWQPHTSYQWHLWTSQGSFLCWDSWFLCFFLYQKNEHFQDEITVKESSQTGVFHLHVTAHLIIWTALRCNGGMNLGKTFSKVYVCAQSLLQTNRSIRNDWSHNEFNLSGVTD